MDWTRRLPLAVAAAAVTTLGFTVPSLAHECINAGRAAAANDMIAQHSHGWFDIQTSQIMAILLVSCFQQPNGDCPPPPPLSAGDVSAIQGGNFEELVGEILGFIPRGPAISDLIAFTDQVAQEASCLGVPTHYLTLAHATAGGGAEDKVGKVLADGKGIDHFPEVYGQQLGTAYGTVLSGGPSACH
jgi:hypothetical protein